MNLPFGLHSKRLNLSRSATPGAVLLSRAAVFSALLVVWNDLWLKRLHPGWISGKLSDVGLLIFLPLFLVAAVEWIVAIVSFARAKTVTRIHLAACGMAALYFVAIKVWPAATHAHVAWLSFVVPRWHFRAVTDPSDLLCLPAILVAWREMKRSSREVART